MTEQCRGCLRETCNPSCHIEMIDKRRFISKPLTEMTNGAELYEMHDLFLG